MLRALIGLAAAFAVSGPAVAQAPASPPPPFIKAGETRKVSDHVWVIPDDSVPLVPNVGIVVGSKATLVVDTGLGERNGRTIMAEVAKLSRNRTLYLVTTHVHPEHDLGAGAFPPETKLIRSSDQVKDIQEFGLQVAQTFAGRSPVNAELLKGAEFRKADQVFDAETSLDLGGVKVRILAMGANHTRGDTAIWVEPDGVLFSGDIAMRAQPAFASPYSNLGHWLRSLDRLEALKPKVVVPSHGPVGDAGFIDGYRAYLTVVRDRTAALKREGRSVEAVTQVLTPELAARYPDAGRLAGAIRAAYAEAKN